MARGTAAASEEQMHRLSAMAIAALGWFAGSTASAQDFCADMRDILAAAPTEFSSLIGTPLPGPSLPDLEVFEGTQSLAGADMCAVAQQTVSGRRFSTSYTCASAGSDTAEGLRLLLGRLQQCLDVTVWGRQGQQGGPRALVAQYGLLRLSITHNGARGGLAVGVEAFRDENGEVMGSPTRGDEIDANDVHRCTAKSPEEIAALYSMYAARPGAERFENEQFVGFTNSVSRPAVAFVTRPVHPAHPAIIVRDIAERDGAVVASAQGDFAGDCAAFHALLQQVREMNEGLGRR